MYVLIIYHPPPNIYIHISLKCFVLKALFYLYVPTNSLTPQTRPIGLPNLSSYMYMAGLELEGS
mgnify:FL=1